MTSDKHFPKPFNVLPKQSPLGYTAAAGEAVVQPMRAPIATVVQRYFATVIFEAPYVSVGFVSLWVGGRSTYVAFGINKHCPRVRLTIMPGILSSSVSVNFPQHFFGLASDPTSDFL